MGRRHVILIVRVTPPKCQKPVCASGAMTAVVHMSTSSAMAPPCIVLRGFSRSVEGTSEKIADALVEGVVVVEAECTRRARIMDASKPCGFE
jgi:hypothetical protein